MGKVSRGLYHFLRARRKAYAPLPALTPPPVIEASPVIEAPLVISRQVRRRVLHLYRLYAVMKAVYAGEVVHSLSASNTPYRQLLKAVQQLEAFEARTQIPVDDKVFALSVFAYHGKDSWPGMFAHADALTYYQRYERRTVHETVTTAPVDDALVQRVAKAWGLSVEEARRRFGPLFEHQP